MHPLNHQERQDKFFYFVVLFTVTLTVTIVAVYTVNALLTDAIRRNNSAKIAQYSSYRQNQQVYIDQLTRLNGAMSVQASGRDSRSASVLINEFNSTLLKNNDTSALMTLVLSTYQNYGNAITARIQAREALNRKDKDLQRCKLQLNPSNP
jgi:hypothetical protein